MIKKFLRGDLNLDYGWQALAAFNIALWCGVILCVATTAKLVISMFTS